MPSFHVNQNLSAYLDFKPEKMLQTAASANKTTKSEVSNNPVPRA
jgi:hypothetical protein